MSNHTTPAWQEELKKEMKQQLKKQFAGRVSDEVGFSSRIELEYFIDGYAIKLLTTQKATAIEIAKQEFYKLEELEKDFDTNQEIIKTRIAIAIKLKEL